MHRKRLVAAGVALALLGVLVFVLTREPPKEDEPDARPGSAELPEWARELPSYPVLQLLSADASLASDGKDRPQLRAHFLARREKEKDFRPLGEGNALASETDDYLVLVEPRTRGFLYVFQVDSSGRLAWLFPENEYCQQSSGSNPVSPPEMTWVPGRDLGPLRLDRVTGHEHLYVAMSGRRWERLEEALAEGSRRGR